MPRFYFHLKDDGGRTEDCEGAVLRDDQAAMTAAVRDVREMMSHEIRETGTLRMDRMIEIIAEDGGVVRLLRFAEAVSLRS